jgi:hypothetical protein
MLAATVQAVTSVGSRLRCGSSHRVPAMFWADAAF